MKNSILRFLILAVISVLIQSRSFAGDEQLQKALDAANAGRSQEAISILEQLRASSPSDARVLLRLGLLYQSERRYADAISTLEAATSAQVSPEALYALGLLYEEQLLAASNPQQKAALQQKAVQAWSGLLNLVPESDARAHRAQHHLKRLSEGQ